MTIHSISSPNPLDGVVPPVSPAAPLAGVLVGGDAFQHEANGEQGQRLDRDALDRQIEVFNRAAQKANLQLSVSVHEGSHRLVVKLIDERTKEIVRELPAEKYLNMIETMQKIAGLNVDVRT